MNEATNSTATDTPAERVQLLRQRQREGNLSIAEMQEAIAFLRQGRQRAAETPKKRAAAKSPARSSEDLLKQLDGL